LGVKHAVVWIDQKEARVFEVDAEKVDRSLVHAPGRHVHRHANEHDLRVRNHPDDEHRFFRDVVHALEAHHQILVVGPSKAKLHFFRFVQQHEQALAQRIVGLETMDHPSDAQLVAYLRHYFGDAAPKGP
jgi:stalled ribosome rescue protein Dom34